MGLLLAAMVTSSIALAGVYNLCILSVGVPIALCACALH